MKKLLALLFLLSCFQINAQSVLGKWKTVDDKTKESNYKTPSKPSSKKKKATPSSKASPTKTSYSISDKAAVLIKGGDGFQVEISTKKNNVSSRRISQ